MYIIINSTCFCPFFIWNGVWKLKYPLFSQQKDSNVFCCLIPFRTTFLHFMLCLAFSLRFIGPCAWQYNELFLGFTPVLSFSIYVSQFQLCLSSLSLCLSHNLFCFSFRLCHFFRLSIWFQPFYILFISMFVSQFIFSCYMSTANLVSNHLFPLILILYVSMYLFLYVSLPLFSFRLPISSLCLSVSILKLSLST